MSKFLDKLIVEFDQGLKSSSSNFLNSNRPYPADKEEDYDMNEFEKNHSTSLMRVNHTGEVCAQALYRGQGLTAKMNATREQMKQAAKEELDHLAWCNRRLEELGGSTSILNPIWYVMSFSLGALAGLAGDKLSLAFVEETENQVVAHLSKHMERISPKDKKSEAIIKQIRIDEKQHAEKAKEAGASELSEELKKLMAVVAKVMTKTSYQI